MRLTQVRVQNYRSVRDTRWFDVEQDKTILVGPNEAGKTAVLEALQRIKPPDAVKGFDVLRDYPRKLYNADIQSGRLDPKNIPVASAWFELEPGDLAELPDGFGATGYRCTRYLDSGHHPGVRGREAVGWWRSSWPGWGSKAWSRRSSKGGRIPAP